MPEELVASRTTTMTSKIKRGLWYVAAAISVAASYLFLNKSLEMVWRSAFEGADVARLRIFFFVYLVLLSVGITCVVICIKKGNKLGKQP